MDKIEQTQKEGSGQGKLKLKLWRKHAESNREVLAFLNKMERSGLVQPFGCLLVVEEGSFRVRAISENLPSLLCGKPASASRPLQFVIDRISRSIWRFNKSRAKFQEATSSVVRDQAVAVASAQGGAGAADIIAELQTSAGEAKPNELGGKLRSMRQMGRSSTLSCAGVVPDADQMPKDSRNFSIGVGDDARILFTRASVLALESAAGSPDMHLMNPVLVQSQATSMPFYAILHRHPGGGILIDLEPIQPSDPIINGAGALQSHKLAAKAVVRLQTIQPGNPKLLYQAVAEEIRALTGYDRVMVYQFHGDEHGEVVGEDRGKNVESYLGLHYPSSDIPKASRMLFTNNRCRMIVDARSNPVRVLQDKGWLGLQSSVNLGMSTLRAVHGCHMQYMANMGVVGSLSLSLVMKDQNGVLLVSMPSQQHGADGKRPPRPTLKTGYTPGSPGTESQQSPSGTAPEPQSPLASVSLPRSSTSSNVDSSDVAGSDIVAPSQAYQGKTGGEAQSSGTEGEAVLWGMVVCHSTQGPKYVSYPVRAACEFLMQVFALQVTRELEAQTAKQEHHILHLQSLLSQIMVRTDPVQSLMSASPGIMGLVKCSGAAHIAPDAFQTCGESPNKEELLDLISWVHKAHPLSTGFTIDSLAASGYPGCSRLSEKVCGLAGAQLGEGQYLFWFREPVAKEIQWGGAKQQSRRFIKEKFKDKTPRASFSTFMEIVKNKSQPWSDVDVDAIHSTQLILRDALERRKMSGVCRAEMEQAHCDEEYEKLYAATFDQLVHFIEAASAPIIAVDLSGCITGWNRRAADLTGLSFQEASGKSLVEDLLDVRSRETAQSALDFALAGTEMSNIHLRLLAWGEKTATLDPGAEGTVTVVANTFISKDSKGNKQGVCFLGQDVTQEKVLQDQFLRIKGDYSAIVHSRTSLVPPIFGCDVLGRCTEWNHGMKDLTGWQSEQVINKMLVGEIFGKLCPLDSHNSKTRLMIALSRSLAGHVTDKLPVAFHDRNGTQASVLLTVHPRYASDGLSICGIFGFVHISGLELRKSVRLQQETERLAAQKSRDVAYLRQEVIGPLNGLHWALAELKRSLAEGKSGQKTMQSSWLKTSSALLSQIDMCLEDVDLDLMEEGYLELNTATFTMENVMSAVVAQTSVAANARECKVTSEVTGSLRSLPLSGDPDRLQQVIAGLTVVAVRFTPAQGLVKIEASHKGTWTPQRPTGSVSEVEIRISHTGLGVPESLINEMMDDSQSNRSEEGELLHRQRLILRCMDKGNVAYVSEGQRPGFVVHVDIPFCTNGRRIGVL